MIRKFFLLATLATPVALLAQGTAPASPGSSTVVMPGTNIYVVGGGLYGTDVYVVPGGAPGVATVAPGAAGGISLAGRAGISLDQPIQTGVQSTLAPSWPATANSAYNAVNATGVYGAPEAAGAESVAPVSAVANDFGPSYSADSAPQAAASLGEIAAYYKANQPQNVRTYTNADAQPRTGIVTIPRTSAGGNTEAADAAPSPVTETHPQPQPSPGNQTVAANTTPPTIAAEAPPVGRAETHEGKSGLPASATLLPLLGLSGVISGGIGLWLRSRFLK